MAALFDNTGSISGEAVSTLTTGLFIIGSDPNLVGIVCIGHNINSATGITSSIGGVSGNLIAGTDTTTGDAARRSLQHGVIAPPSGLKSATASWTGACAAVVGAITATGADQVTGFQNGTQTAASATTPNITVTSAVNNLTVVSLAQLGSRTETLATQTEEYNVTSATSLIVCAVSTGAGAATVNHQWTQSGSAKTTPMSGCDIIASSGGAAAVPLTPTIIRGGTIRKGIIR